MRHHDLACPIEDDVGEEALVAANQARGDQWRSKFQQVRPSLDNAVSDPYLAPMPASSLASTGRVNWLSVPATATTAMPRSGRQ